MEYTAKHETKHEVKYEMRYSVDGAIQSEVNALGQPVGQPVLNWQTAPRPARDTLEGRYCRVEPLNPDRHAADLYAANARDLSGGMWTYLAYGPFETVESYRAWLESVCDGEDPLFYAIVDRATGRAAGVAAYLRIDPRNGCIEVGHLCFSPLLQRTPAATEAMYLMMEWVFTHGYRRYEWKCNALNASSRAAALRLGFAFEGIFRQATIVKGRNRDTAWYAAIDTDWPALRTTFQRWLDPANFDAEGRQYIRLSEITEPMR